MTLRPGRLVLLGHPVSHSLSPRIQNAALHAAGIDVLYEALDVDPAAFDATIDALRRERAAGNVTVPHKERMFAACEVLAPLAQHVGAVNTFWFDDAGRLVGDNTDVGGFSAPAANVMGQPPRDITVGVYGAGGAAAAVLAAVELWPGCRAHVYNRTPERARALCERFSTIAHSVDDVAGILGSELVVNATSIGLRDNAFPIELDLIPEGRAILDLVYRRGETPWVRRLRRRRFRAMDGIGMLIEQAALAFERWFGVTADRAVMWNALDELPDHS